MLHRFSRIFLSFCLLVSWLALVASAQEAGPSLSREERLKVFTRVWQAINDRYYDPNFNGVDWRRLKSQYQPKVELARNNDELYSWLRRMVGELGDAHTRVYAPEEGFDRYRPAGTSVGLAVQRIEGRLVVVWVEPGSEAARQGIRPGYVLLRVNHTPVEELLARLRDELVASSSPTAFDQQSFNRLFAGPRDTTLALTFIDDEGHSRIIELKRRFTEFPRRVLWRRLPHDLGYIDFNGFGPEIERDFAHAVRALQDTRGLILDLRHNGGGFVRTVVQVASYFLPEETELGEFISRTGRSTRHRTQRLRLSYRSPLVVLVSTRSASGAEMLTAALQENRRAFVIGTHPSTCGCLLGVSRTLPLPDGGKLNVSDTDYRTARGRRIEGTGIKPDQVLELRISDLLSGRDRPLEAAVKHLLSKNE